MREARPLGQFALACFLVGGGYFTKEELQRRLSPHVAAALDDAMPFLDLLEEVEDPWDVGTVALQLLEVARLHGLMQDAGKNEPDPAQRGRFRLVDHRLRWHVGPKQFRTVDALTAELARLQGDPRLAACDVVVEVGAQTVYRDVSITLDAVRRAGFEKISFGGELAVKPK